MKASEKTIGTRLRAFSTHYVEYSKTGIALRLVGIAVGILVLIALTHSNG